MRSERPAGPSSTSDAVSAGAIGAGGGTILVVIANNLPSDFPHRFWIVLLAPWVSVSLAAGWARVRQAMSYRRKDRELKDLFARAEQSLLRIINGAHTSETAKAQARADLESLLQRRAQLDQDRFNALILKQ